MSKRDKKLTKAFDDWVDTLDVLAIVEPIDAFIAGYQRGFESKMPPSLVEEIRKVLEELKGKHLK